MRYFDLQLTDSKGNVATAAGTTLRWTTHPNGIMAPGDPNYPLITFDATVIDDIVQSGATTIRVFGVPLKLLSSATQLVGLTCILRGGMTKGLPLESSHPGILMKGTVWQAFGNWVGTQMELDLVVSPLLSQPGESRKVLFQWKPGQSLAAAISAALQPIYGPYQVPIDVSGVSPNYPAPASVKTGMYASVEAFAHALYGMTEKLAPGPVVLSVTGQRVLARSKNAGVAAQLAKASSGAVIPIDFNELIGQPTWISVLECQVKTVLRGDLDVGRRVRILQSGAHVLQSTPGLATVTAASGIGLPIMAGGKKYIPNFQGDFLVYSLRHLGNSRSTDSGEWATIFNAIALNQTVTGAGAQPVPSIGGPT